jgi:hypothetical protein
MGDEEEDEEGVLAWLRSVFSEKEGGMATYMPPCLPRRPGWVRAREVLLLDNDTPLRFRRQERRTCPCHLPLGRAIFDWYQGLGTHRSV